MKKAEFIEAIAKKAECSVSEARNMLNIIGDITLDSIAKNDFVPFAFGRIGGKTKEAHVARNPRTGESVQVPEKEGRPYCKFGKTAKE